MARAAPAPAAGPPRWGYCQWLPPCPPPPLPAAGLRRKTRYSHQSRAMPRKTTTSAVPQRAGVTPRCPACAAAPTTRPPPGRRWPPPVAPPPPRKAKALPHPGTGRCRWCPTTLQPAPPVKCPAPPMMARQSPRPMKKKQPQKKRRARQKDSCCYGALASGPQMSRNACTEFMHKKWLQLFTIKRNQLSN